MGEEEVAHWFDGEAHCQSVKVYGVNSISHEPVEQYILGSQLDEWQFRLILSLYLHSRSTS